MLANDGAWVVFPRHPGQDENGLGNVSGLKRTSHGVRPGPRNHDENWHTALLSVRSRDSSEIGGKKGSKESGNGLTACSGNVSEESSLFRQRV